MRDKRCYDFGINFFISMELFLRKKTMKVMGKRSFVCKMNEGGPHERTEV